MDHSHRIYSLDYWAQKIQSVMKYDMVLGEKKGCQQQTCCSYKDDLAPAHKTIPEMNEFFMSPEGEITWQYNHI
jgi:hypothetical protein